MRNASPSQLDLPLAYRQQQAVGRAYLALEGTLVAYTIRRSVRRRAISILVDEEGVRVGAPWDATHHAIERLLHKHSAWVLRKLQEWQVRRAPERRWADGETLMLLGLPFTLKLLPEPATVHVRDAHLCVGPPGRDGQSGVGRGLFEVSTLNAIHDRMQRALGQIGGRIDAIFFCPHAEEANCNCRKPRAGLLEEIGRRFSVDLGGVPSVGDSLRDLQAAAAVGAEPILVLTGKGEATHKAGNLPDGTRVYPDLATAVRAIVR